MPPPSSVSPVAPGQVAIERDGPMLADQLPTTNGPSSQLMAAARAALALGVPDIPPRSAPGTRRFAAAEELQTSGSIPVELVLRYLGECIRMLESPRTLRLLADELSAGGASAMQRKAMGYQMELIEAHGIDRYFGVQQLDRPEQYGDALRQPMLLFYRACTDLAARVERVRRGAVDEAEHAAAASLIFEPAEEPLQRRGELRRETVLRVCNDLAHALFTGPILHVLAAKPPAEMPMECIVLQRQYLEHAGVEMGFGCDALARVAQRFGDDAEVMSALTAFTRACQLSVQKAMTLRAEAAGRLFAPSADGLQTRGELSRDAVLQFCNGVAKALFTAPVLEAIAEKSEEEACALCVYMQRQYLEHVGIEMEFGCEALARVPQRYADDAEVMRAFKAFTLACEMCVKKATMMRAEHAARMFQRSAGELQRKGELSRELVLQFCDGVAKELFSAPVLELIATKPEEQAKDACVYFQRQYLEHLGIEMEFGCEALARVPELYADDAEVMRVFKSFTLACQVCVRKAMIVRAEHASADPRAPSQVAPSAADTRPPLASAEPLFPRAHGSLQRRGELSRKLVLRFCDGATKALFSPAAQQLLAAASPAEAPAVCVTLQREYLEHIGVDMDFGCQALGRVRQLYEGDADVMFVFDCFTAACRLSVHTASFSRGGTRTSATAGDASGRLFLPAAKLQREGALGRKAVLRFCNGVAAALFEPLPQEALAAASDELRPAACVRLQHEYLEHVGIEMEFGCKELGRVPKRFADDSEVMRAFDSFTGACRLSAHLARLGVA